MKTTDLSLNFYTMPNNARQTMNRKDWQELLLDTGGKILTCGRLRKLKGKYLGAGIYDVTLEVLD